jgi:hypothetical protein
MVRLLLLFFTVSLSVSSAWAADYSTSPCIAPAQIDPNEHNTTMDSAVNTAISDEIKKSVTAELALPLQDYSAAAPSQSKLFVGDVNVSGGQVSVNGVDLDSPVATTAAPPCVIELKPVQ